jgi:hypothetical protein
MWYDSSHMSPEKKKLKKTLCSCVLPVVLETGQSSGHDCIEKKTSVRTSTVARLHCPVHTRSCQLPTWPGLEKRIIIGPCPSGRAWTGVKQTAHRV